MLTKNDKILFRCLGEQQSFAGRQRERLSAAFESSRTAKKRKESIKENEVPNKKPKKHSGSFEGMTWDKDGLKSEIEGYEDDRKINWSEIARRYNITNKKGQISKNGGQIAQEWLISQGVNLHRFQTNSPKERKPRRKKLKGAGGYII